MRHCEAIVVAGDGLSHLAVELPAHRSAVFGVSAGADVVMTERTGSHGGAFWKNECPLMVAWAFGR